MMAARAEPSGMRVTGAKRPARPAASSAPRIRPKLVTEVVSARIGPSRAAAGIDQVQYSQLLTSRPTRSASLAPHRLKAKVTDHGCPDSSRLATLSSARASEAQASGQ